MSGEELLRAYLDRELAPDDEAAFLTWLEEDPEHVRMFVRETHFDESVRRTVIAARGLVATNAGGAVCAELAKHMAEVESGRLWQRWSVRLAFAAAVLLLALGGWWRINFKPSSPSLTIAASNGEVSVRRGGDVVSVRQLVLQEGDVIVTGSGASAVLAFAGEQTELALRENTALAFTRAWPAKEFDLQAGKLGALVAPQPSGRPMIVRAPQAKAWVLGTRFQLSTQYDGTRLAVSEGKVRFAAPDGKSTGELNSGQTGTATLEGGVAAPDREEALPAPWQSQDIGVVARTGTTEITDGTFTVKASGEDIWNQADGFHFVHRKAKGDVVITARVARIDRTDNRAKAGVMIRESFAAGARHVSMSVSAGWDAWFHCREQTDGPSAARQRPNAKHPLWYAPYWVRLARAGNLFTASISKDGIAWTVVATRELDLPAEVLTGLHVTSHDNAKFNTSVFDHVSVAPLSPGSAP